MVVLGPLEVERARRLEGAPVEAGARGRAEVGTVEVAVDC